MGSYCLGQNSENCQQNVLDIGTSLQRDGFPALRFLRSRRTVPMLCVRRLALNRYK